MFILSFLCLLFTLIPQRLCLSFQKHIVIVYLKIPVVQLNIVLLPSICLLYHGPSQSMADCCTSDIM